MKQKQIGQLISVIEIVQAMLAEAIHDATQAEAKKVKRRRGEALAAFYRAVAAERKAGVPVPAIARKYGVAPTYIYMITPEGRRRAAKKKR